MQRNDCLGSFVCARCVFVKKLYIVNDSKHIGDLFTMMYQPTGRLDGIT